MAVPVGPIRSRLFVRDGEGGPFPPRSLILVLPRRLLAIVGLSLAAVLVAALLWGQPRRVLFRSQMTVEEYASCGLAKLSPAELEALEAWLNGRTPVQARKLGPPPEVPAISPELAVPISSSPAPVDPSALATQRAPEEWASTRVAFNVATHKVHCPSCLHARRCTRNCVEISLAEALERGGVRCKVCGGNCR